MELCVKNADIFFRQCVCHLHWQTTSTYECAPSWFYISMNTNIRYSFRCIFLFCIHRKNWCPAFTCKHRQERENSWDHRIWVKYTKCQNIDRKRIWKEQKIAFSVLPKRIYNYLARIFFRPFRSLLVKCLCFLNNFQFQFRFWIRFSLSLYPFYSRQIDCDRCDRWQNVQRCLITKWFCNVPVEFPRQHTVHCELYIMRIYYPLSSNDTVYHQH